MEAAQPLPDLHAAEVQELDFMQELEAKIEKERLWRQQRIKKFTSSQAYRLMTGADQTEEDAIEAIASGNTYKVAELQELCEEHAIDTAGMKYKRHYAEALIKAKKIPYGVEVWPQGAETYVVEKVIEELTNEPFYPEINTRAMMHGKDHEVEAMQTLSAKTGLQMEMYGDEQEFIDQHHPLFYKAIPKELHPYIGCTPDSKVVKKKEGAETKCPDKHTHFKYKLGIASSKDLKEEYKEAYWQCISTMYITGWQAMIFESYDPRFTEEVDRSLIIKVKRNEAELKKYETRLLMAVKRYQEIKAEWIKTRTNKVNLCKN